MDTPANGTPNDILLPRSFKKPTISRIEFDSDSPASTDIAGPSAEGARTVAAMLEVELSERVQREIELRTEEVIRRKHNRPTTQPTGDLMEDTPAYGKDHFDIIEFDPEGSDDENQRSMQTKDDALTTAAEFDSLPEDLERTAKVLLENLLVTAPKEMAVELSEHVQRLLELRIAVVMDPDPKVTEDERRAAIRAIDNTMRMLPELARVSAVREGISTLASMSSLVGYAIGGLLRAGIVALVRPVKLFPIALALALALGAVGCVGGPNNLNPRPMWPSVKDILDRHDRLVIEHVGENSSVGQVYLAQSAVLRKTFVLALYGKSNMSTEARKTLPEYGGHPDVYPDDLPRELPDDLPPLPTPEEVDARPQRR
jgi:hypothetical protein